MISLQITGGANPDAEPAKGARGIELVPPSEQRSSNMRAIKGSNTKPELLVRRMLHGMGYRYQLHRKDLPGKPDIVFGPRRKVIFIHGCFWHGHACKHGQRVPKTNTEYWTSKIAGNVERDRRQLEELSEASWTAMTLWECELRDADAVRARLTAFLDDIVGQ